jgi:hypothetical protein
LVSASSGPIHLSRNWNTAETILSFQTATLNTHQHIPGRSEFNDYQVFEGWNDEIRVSPIFSGPAASRGLINRAETHFVLKHEFNLASSIQTEVRAELEARVRSSVWKATGGASIILDTIEIAARVLEAQAKAESIQSDLMSLADYGRMGEFFRDLGISTVFVAGGSSNLEIYLWPSTYSQGGLSALNTVVRPQISWEAFVQNPLVAFEAHNNLNEMQVYQVANAAEAYRAERREAE